MSENLYSKLVGKQVFVGFDGYIDELVKVVRLAKGPGHRDYFDTIGEFAEYISNAANKSCDVEIASISRQFGGNAQLLSQAMSMLGANVTCVGTMGYPEIMTEFEPLAGACELHTVGNPGIATAFEFNDGKLMFAKNDSLHELTLERFTDAADRSLLIEKIRKADIICLVNWSNLLHMSDIWGHMLRIIRSVAAEGEKKVFFDLADMYKRTQHDIEKLADILRSFGKYCDACLGLNRNEAELLYDRLCSMIPADLDYKCKALRIVTNMGMVVIHTVEGAYIADKDGVVWVEGSVEPQPSRTTGGGDNFNAGFCAGILLGLDKTGMAKAGNRAANYYVANGRNADFNQVFKD